MLNLYTWGRDHMQVVFEGASFYFAHKMPVAFRPMDDLKIMIPNIIFGKHTKEFIDMLQSIAKIDRVPKNKFRSLMEKEYNRAVMSGAERIAKRRLLNGRDDNIHDEKGTKNDEVVFHG